MQAWHLPKERGLDRSLGRKNVRLQHSSKKVLVRLLESPRAKESPLGSPGPAPISLLYLGKARPWCEQFRDPKGAMAGSCQPATPLAAGPLSKEISVALSCDCHTQQEDFHSSINVRCYLFLYKKREQSLGLKVSPRFVALPLCWL